MFTPSVQGVEQLGVGVAPAGTNLRMIRSEVPSFRSSKAKTALGDSASNPWVSWVGCVRSCRRLKASFSW